MNHGIRVETVSIICLIGDGPIPYITCREYSSTRSDGASARIVYDYFDALSKEF